MGNKAVRTIEIKLNEPETKLK